MAKLQLFSRIESGTFTFGTTENPQWLATKQRRVYILTPPLPMDTCFQLQQRLEKGCIPRLLRVCKSLIPLRRFLWLRLNGLGYRFPGFPIPLTQISYEENLLATEEQQSLWDQIMQLLSGRILSDSQLLQGLGSNSWWPADILRTLEQGFQSGAWLYQPGIVKEPWGVHRCLRCNSLVEHSRPCYSCGRDHCPVCLSCQSLGEIRGCTRLIVPGHHGTRKLPNKYHPVKDHLFQLDYALTTAQERASQELIKFLYSDPVQILVWAACGAGKTEVTFGAISQTLQAGGQVLFAIPRRDVVREIAERLQKSFPTVTVVQHYAGQPWNSPGDLVVATTHQALRFYQRFALVILDEVDAFPYQGSDMLRFAMDRARIPGGKLIEMTATPKRIPRGDRLITIPARYHGFPLPTPAFVKLKLPKWTELAKHSLPHQVLEPFADPKTVYLVFVPTVAAARHVGDFLKSHVSQSVCHCSAQDPLRKEKRDGLESGAYQIMVTTSIMERGITIANVQVMVLYCDHPVFTEQSLVQMAGRVGRKKAYPQGWVMFFGERYTSHVKEAIQRINYLNEQAKQQGLLLEV